MQLQSKVYLIGTYQAVSEAAMRVWTSNALVNLSSDGIRPLDVDAESGRNLHILECSCDEVTGSAGAHCEGLSREFPHLVVGLSVVGSGFLDIPADHCVWGASAHLDGVTIVDGLTCSLPSSLPPDLVQMVDDSVGAGALPSACIPRLHMHALGRFEMEARARLGSATVERWGPLTRSVAAKGLDGLVPEQGSDRFALTRLVTAVQAARRDGVASWLDTLMFASRGEDEAYVTARGRGAKPFSTAEHATWGARHLELLRAVARSGVEDLGMTWVVDAISSPWVRFQDGSHPMPWLATLRLPDGDIAHAGLRRLIDTVGAHGFDIVDDGHRAQAVRAVKESGFTSESIRLAVRMGVSPGYIASRALPVKGAPEAEQLWVGSGLIDGFKGIYGDIAQFPEELCRAFAGQSEPVAQAFEARKTEELMASAIANWKPAARAAGSEVKVTVKRRRSVV